MRIPLALLADHASAHQTDGKLYVIGGGIKVLPFAVFPAIQPQLSLALGIEVAPDELGMDHTLTIESRSPMDEAVSQPVSVTFSVLPGNDPSRPGYFHFVSNMDNVGFPVEGDYVFAIAIDAEQLAQITVRAERSDDAKLAAEVAAQTQAGKLLAAGYEAFNRGEVDAAEAAFKILVDRFPNLPGGHNNLGFVLLARGEATAALEAFTKAKQLGYPQDEIGDANVACALYLAGDAAGALRGFVDCLQTHIFSTPATLFGIGASGLFPVVLASAAEYASLMALNAAWSAAGAGDASAAARYLASARAGELSLEGDETDRLFVESVNALGAKSEQWSSRSPEKSG
jgi:hypothetical protein